MSSELRQIHDALFEDLGRAFDSWVEFSVQAAAAEVDRKRTGEATEAFARLRDLLSRSDAQALKTVMRFILAGLLH